MSKLIAITGKGGVGKTTISALLVRQLLATGREPVLAVDADPNSCLDAALGVTVDKTVGRAREEVREEAEEAARQGIGKQDLLELKIAESLVEAKGFDLISMGRPEGAGCYCYANSVLSGVLGRIADAYPYCVLDNEAGLENLSRRIIQNVDLLVLVSDASNAGLTTLQRLHILACEMNIKYDKLVLVVNRLRGAGTSGGPELPPKAMEIKEATKADMLIALPDDAQVAQFAENNRCLLELPEENPLLPLINEIIEEL
ncbi:MAG: AAA family ATPase [Clostridia bacterium]|nr:AAA family ATPase [Clostridia bacterium]